MNKTRLSILAAGLIALLTACGDNIVEAGDSSIATEATLRVLVVDGITGEPLKGASVKVDGASKKTDAKGTANMGKFRVGSHNAQIELAGYAFVEATVEIKGSGQSQGVYIAQDGTGTISLYPETATLEGYVFYTDKDGKSLPAKEAKVSISNVSGDGNYRKATQTVETDENGKYVFENLPATDISYTLIISDFEVGDVTYPGSSKTNQNASLNPGAVAQVATDYNVKLDFANIVKPPFQLLGYTKDLTKEDDDIVFTFSDNIDPKESSVNAGEFVDPIWKDNTLTLKLFKEGRNKWLLSSVTTATGRGVFTISSISAKSVNGETISVLEDKRKITVGYVDLAGKKVNATIHDCEPSTSTTMPVTCETGNTKNYMLKWDELPGAIGYDVYEKEADGNYTLKGSISHDDKGTKNEIYGATNSCGALGNGKYCYALEVSSDASNNGKNVNYIVIANGIGKGNMTQLRDAIVLSKEYKYTL